jgi:hypothetical protein
MEEPDREGGKGQRRGEERRGGRRERDLEIIAKVIDNTSGSRSGEGIVEASEEEAIFREKLQETTLSLLQQDHEVWRILRKDLREGELDLGDLPEQARNGDRAERRERIRRIDRREGN